MNFYLRRTPFTPTFVRFAAKCSAICRKMQCVLVLNVVRFDAKCNAFWCEMQGKMPQNAVQNGAKCEKKSINIR